MVSGECTVDPMVPLRNLPSKSIMDDKTAPEWQTDIATGPVKSIHEPVTADPCVILSSIGEAVYDWDIESDTLVWSPNALELLKISEPERIATGKFFNELIDPVSPATRAEAILLCDGIDSGHGVPYRLQLALLVEKSGVSWFEDTGRWFAGSDGRAGTAHGVVRRIEAPQSNGRTNFAAPRIDPLTGAYERSPFIRLMADDLRRAGQKDVVSCFVLASIPELSAINKSHGFDVADEVIAVVAQRLRGTTRGKDRMVRCSGNKLGLLLTPFDPANMKEAIGRLSASVSTQPIVTSVGAVMVALKMGVVLSPAHGHEPIALMRLAEQALAEAKLSPVETFVLHTRDPAKDEARRRNLSESDDVLSALNERRVCIAFEPVCHSGSKEVAFHEALVRVRSGENEILGASAIIPAAERFNLVKFVDTRVLELAVAHLVANPAAQLSVNVSMRTAVAPEWMAALRAQVQPYPGLAARLIIEVTETAAMADIEMTSGILRQVKELGCRVAIDDFGSGHTSFRSLRTLPIDVLKIDGVFVQNIATSVDDRFFVRTLIDLAKHLGVKTVAEWVQDQAAADMLAEWGVDWLQGEFCGLATLEVPKQIAAAAPANFPRTRVRDLRFAS